MTDIAVRVESLSKLYRIGRSQQRHADGFPATNFTKTKRQFESFVSFVAKRRYRFLCAHQSEHHRPAWSVAQKVF